MLQRLCVPALAAILLALPAEGQEKGEVSAEAKGLDRHVYHALRDVINQGADLFNGGDHAASYFVFHGALVTVGPMLEHRPALQKRILDGLHKARGQAKFVQRAQTLRTVIDEVRNEVGPTRMPGSPDTLWERLGGEPTVKRVVDDFVAAAAADPKVNFTRDGKVKDVDVARLKKLLLEQISEAAGGPYRYTGRSMREAHKGMGINEAEFEALANHLRRSLQKHVKADKDAEAILKAVAGTRGDIVEPKAKPAKQDLDPPPPLDPPKKALDPEPGKGGTPKKDLVPPPIPLDPPKKGIVPPPPLDPPKIPLDPPKRSTREP